MLAAHTPNMISLHSYCPPFLLPLLLLSLSLFICAFSGTTTLLQGQSLTDDGQTLISPAKIFELGFFSPEGSSGRRYLGIYYHNIPTQSIVWIANRDSPLLDSSGILSLGTNGNLSLLDGATGNSLWSTNTSTTSNNSLSLVLLDTGRLVLQLANETVIWDSFDHPADTFLPGMKLLFNKKIESRILFKSWRSADDPSTGNYSLGLDSSGQIFIWEGEGDSRPRWRSGQWDGTKFIGTTMRPLYLYGFHLTNDVDNGLIYFTYTEFNSSLLRFVLQWDGVENTSMLVMKTKQWESVWVQPVNDCEIYGKCGEFGICSQSSSPICRCLKGFEPRNGEEWGNGNWSGGCVRRTELGCEMNGSRDGKDGFFKVEGVKVPDLSDWASTVRNNEDCESYCQSNCSCKAYAYVLGIGCFTWDRRIIDVYEFAEGENSNGNDLYIKLAASEFDWWKKHRMIEVSFDGLASKRTGITESSGLSGSVDEGLEANRIELPLYSFDSIATATNNFNNSNKLGEGGFGHVYKGVLPDGKDIAVKRLSRSSGQGQQEFKNEMTLIAKLQHRNLVRLLGCCIQGEENMLIYEYMPNKSLDAFIFAPDKQGLLGWSKRFDIIEGIARGLVYLHQDSRLRIIHRDLKASNILLDESMNPKISDFGMARIFGNDQNQDNTERVVGTFGYMAPEYGMEGLFSVKSDVYSFGILVLEIVSGRRNNSFHRMGNSIINIVGYAWQLWNEDRTTELIDSSILETCSTRQVMRCIHVGLLCVQDRANDRPDMPSVLLMLGRMMNNLPTPKQPTYISQGNHHCPHFLLPLLLLSLSLFIRAFSGTTTLLQGQSLTDNGQTLISPAKIFELGFFSPEGSSSRRYLGIYYHNIPTRSIVWIANRDSPLLDSSGILSLGTNGNLSLLDGATGNSLWSTDTSTTSNNSLSLMLLDTGQLVLQLAKEKIIWDSFAHPADTFLPGMKILFNKKTDSRILFRSWRSADDPSTGNYSLGLDSSAQIFIWEGDSRPRWRSGQWDGTKFIGTTMRPLYLYGFHLTNDVHNGLIYFTYTQLTSSLLRFVLQWDGVPNVSMLVMKTKQWESIWVQPVNDCEIYGKCGEFGICSQSSSPICSCFKGFEPRNVEEWGNGNWSGGCVRRTELGCEMNGSRNGEDGFFKVEGVKVPDLSDWASTVRNNEDCESYCQSNCSCKAYAYVLGIGCFTWDRRIIDVSEFAKGKNSNGNDLYIKLAASELDWWEKHRMREVSFDSLASKRTGITESSGLSGSVDEGLEANRIELPLYSFDSIATATNNFNNSNKLGEGGFGHVYKGALPDGKDIAVKRLSRSSGQGQQEFKNEMTLIAKLQHRNLVRLLGCCVQGEEKMLIYEYMPNKRLDAFIFVPDKQGLLGWSKRFDIIEGIARGLVYLHQDSRLRIIHRDLKASNILLDESMNPKISDFGMARIFGNDQNQDNTERVVGTFGYMAPEYGMEGLFSVKSDVYSFGILVLEIVSGRRNNSFHRMGNSIINIVGYAWQLWNEDRATELIDSSILETCSTRQVMRCIHVGLLCVQDRANDRPDMSSVLLMLGSMMNNLPTAKQPSYISQGNKFDTKEYGNESFSANDMTITMESSLLLQLLEQMYVTVGIETV
ncbi:hypothetical protein IEQ34_012121 [Dendrobium chrysotoxum]|uniref:non-specific serine/threonine protein kinase n=1 Tax=Dendrobium chrysotoxum TaxID=161865 RepID=A0AAV7GT33_DENCH|nr:hypothetical protein IEQ34_012121 [Dendrobium chrysotoxum]